MLLMHIRRRAEGRPLRAQARLGGLLVATLAVLLLLLSCGEEPSDRPDQRHPPLATAQPTPANVLTSIIVRLPIVTPRPTARPAPASPWPTATPPPTPTPLIHVIVAGDNLWDLSRNYGINVSALQEVNAILNPRRLQLGQEIVIPPPEPEEDQLIPTPTPLAYAIRGLTFHKTSAGSLWCLGEVWNTSGATLEEVQLQVVLLDETAHSVATGQGVPALDTITPDQRVPFALLFRDPPQSFSHYQAHPLRGTAALPGAHGYTHLAVIENEGRVQDHHFVVEGQVRNTGTIAATAWLVATAYDAQGNVIGLRSHRLLSPLAPGSQSPFTITLLPVSQPVSSFTVLIKGLEVVQGG